VKNKPINWLKFNTPGQSLVVALFEINKSEGGFENRAMLQSVL